MLVQQSLWEDPHVVPAAANRPFPSSIHVRNVPRWARAPLTCAARSPSQQDYKIIAQIGKGAFGIVYEGRVDDRRVAIKALAKATIKGHNLQQRVRNEVAIHYQLRHPNILELLHFFEDSENVYLVMELAAEELYQRLRRQRLTVEEVRRIFAAVVEGLFYLHSHGIIHRDLKLSNILLTENLQPKIADFGLAAKIEGDRDCEQKTLCGTPNYLAPEVILKNPYGKAADLWSLGCMLYTLLVGRPPFESTDIRDTFARVRRGDFRIPDSITPSARDLITRLIVLDPSQRLSLEQIRRHPFVRLPPSPGRTKVAPHSPLTTGHLRPIRQQTRHGILEILSDGRLLIDFANDDKVMVIAADGSRVALYPRLPQSPPHFDGTAAGRFTRPAAEFVFPHLPGQVQSRYEYGRRFVTLLRSKTPQVVLLTDMGRAYLMDAEDAHLADFQLRSGTGSRLEYSPVAKRLTIRSPDGGEERHEGVHLPSAEIGSLSHSRHWELIREGLRQYERCLQAALALAGDRDAYPFPYVIRETCLQAPAVADITAPQMRTFINSTMAAMPPGSFALPADGERSFEYAYKTHIPGVGWCLASAGEQFLLLFADGQTVLIDGKRNRVAYHDRAGDGPAGRPAWHSIDQQLPPTLKQKLSFFPQFVNLLKSGQGHSFVS